MGALAYERINENLKSIHSVIGVSMKKYLLLATVLLVLGCSVTKRIDKGIKPSEIQFLTKHNLSATIVTTPTLKNEKYMSKGGVCKIHLYPGNLNIFSGTLNNVFQSISISDENDDNINSDIKIILENTFERDQENKLYFIQSVHIFETLNNTKLNSFQSRILLSTSPGKIKSNIYKTVLIGTLGLSTFPLMQLRSEEIKQVLSKVMQEASLDIAKQISENDFIRQFAKDKSVYYKQVPNNENIIYGVLERPEVNYNIEDIVKNDLVDSNRRFTIFYSKSDYLHDLLKENKIEAALTFLDSNKNVIKIDKKLKHLLIKGREQLLDKYTLLFHETLYFLSETFPEDRKSNGFKFSSNVIQRISIAIENWKTLRRLLPNNKTLPEEKLLISKASNILKQEFLSFDHFGSENFFNFFPTDVFAFSFPTEYLTELINKEPDINKFKILWGKYKDEISDNDRAYKKFSRLFLNTFENKITRDQNDRILYVLECNHFIIEKNLHRDLLQKINVAIVMPPFLEKDSKIDIKNDLGYLDIDFIDTDNACKKGLDQFDLAIFIFLKETKLQHTLLSKEKISSKFIASYSVQPNPRYIGIQNLISELQNRILIASLNQNNTYSTSVAEALSNLSDTITLSSLRLQLRKARNLLINTPPTIKIPQYSSY